MARSLTDDEVQAIASAHDRALRTVQPIRRPTLDHPSMTIDDAYACQSAWIDLQIASGARIAGHKIGLTSRAMQQAMRIDEPDFGVLLEDMFIPDGGSIEASRHIDPKLEVELAFVLGADLGGSDVTEADAWAAVAHVSPAVELIDARSHRIDPVDGTPRTVRDTIADNAADSGLIVGEARIAPGERDLRWVAAIMTRSGVVEETGVAAGVLGDPIRGVVWLARRLAGFGVTLRAGETILAGSFTRPADCRPGDHFEIDFADLGTITLDVE